MFNWNLDNTTRKFMIEEIEQASVTKNIYFSSRFNERGISEWVSLLTEAARFHNEHWLAYQLEVQGMMKGTEGSRTPSGGYTTKHVPDTATATMAEGQFNRFYILGLCRCVQIEGGTHLVVYRAKDRVEHRLESDSMIGSELAVDRLLAALRSRKKSLSHSLLKPNSGLSVRLKE